MTNVYNQSSTDTVCVKECEDLRNIFPLCLEKGEVALVQLTGYTKPMQEVKIKAKNNVLEDFGIIFANYKEPVETPYIGSDCNWYIPVLATRDTEITANTVICEASFLVCD